MRLVFMGTPEFAVASLERMHQDGHDIAAVVTAPDKPAGRGQQLQMSDVKKKALELHLPVLQPIKLKDPDFQIELRNLNADLFVIVAFRMLPESVWSMPPKGSINLHASLLPRYRGAAPIQQAILQGDSETGVTTFFLQQEIDTGNILFQKKCPILEEDTGGSLYERLKNLGAELLSETLLAIEQNNYHEIPQSNEGPLISAPKIFREDGLLHFEQNRKQIRDRIRAFNPFPSAWCWIDAKVVKIHAASFGQCDKSLSMGELYYKDNRLWVGCGDGPLCIDLLQVEGKRKMSPQEWLNGYQIQHPIAQSSL